MRTKVRNHRKIWHENPGKLSQSAANNSHHSTESTAKSIGLVVASGPARLIQLYETKQETLFVPCPFLKQRLNLFKPQRGWSERWRGPSQRWCCSCKNCIPQTDTKGLASWLRTQILTQADQPFAGSVHVNVFSGFVLHLEGKWWSQADNKENVPSKAWRSTRKDHQMSAILVLCSLSPSELRRLADTSNPGSRSSLCCHGLEGSSSSALLVRCKEKACCSSLLHVVERENFAPLLHSYFGGTLSFNG